MSSTIATRQTDMPPTETATTDREVRFQYDNNIPRILDHLNVSLLVSTYQAGKLAVMSARENSLDLSFHNFNRAMGLAVAPDQIALGAHRQIWFLDSAPEIARQFDPHRSHDGCYVTRRSHYTGDIQIHEMSFGGGELWFVNTLFSCLSTLDACHSFEVRWRPPFISTVAAEDRCHLNGMAMDNGRPRFVTVLAPSDEPAGWRPVKADGGCVLEVPSGEVVTRGLAMPHSPRLVDGRLFVLDSGKGRLVAVDLSNGARDTVAELPGYARGLAIHRGVAFVGLSQVREKSTFGGLPIGARCSDLKCGVAVVELVSGQVGGVIEFQTGVEEIFDVSCLAGVRQPVFSGPYAQDEGGRTIWLVPAERPLETRGEPETQSVL